MRATGPALALILVLASNAVALWGVARNRSGEPDATVELTERELRTEQPEAENSGLSMKLVWSVVLGEDDWRPGWFDRQKLEAVGFECRLSPEDPSAKLRYAKALPIEAYVVLEYEGRAWQEWLAAGERRLEEAIERARRGEITAKQIESVRNGLESARRTHSRLFVVDAGRDPVQLRLQYPDRSRTIVAPAVLRLELVELIPTAVAPKPGQAFLQGVVQELLVNSIHVPLPRRASLAALGIPKPDEYVWQERLPRYSVRLRYGKRHEPWIESVEPLPSSASPER